MKKTDDAGLNGSVSLMAGYSRTEKYGETSTSINGRLRPMFLATASKSMTYSGNGSLPKELYSLMIGSRITTINDGIKDTVTLERLQLHGFQPKYNWL